MLATPTRHWFQFRLRTLLVGVVLIGAACAYVAHEGRIVAARQQWIADNPKMFECTMPGTWSEPTESGVPLVRRLLGDKPTTYLEAQDQAEYESMKKLFPEAHLAVAVRRPD